MPFSVFLGAFGVDAAPIVTIRAIPLVNDGFLMCPILVYPEVHAQLSWKNSCIEPSFSGKSFSHVMPKYVAARVAPT